MKIVKLEKEKISKIAILVKKTLKKGGLAVIPSDTAYGLAVNAKMPKAVEKIFNFKGRRFGKGVSVFLNKIEEIKKYADLPKDKEELVKTLLPGPFTIVLKSKGKVAAKIEPTDKTVGIRIIDQPLIKKLTKNCPFAITATSANISGKGPHYSIEAFLKTLSNKKKSQIDLIIDAGPLTRKPTSTVIRLVSDQIKILRKGILNPKLTAKFTTKKASQTREVAKKIYQKHFKKLLAKKGVLAILKGDLGAGKTVFAKGVGEIFNQNLVSPTFVLMDEYQINQPPLKNLYHLDLYRIENEKEVLELRIEKLLKPGNLVLIEWGEKLTVFQKLKKSGAKFFLVQIETKKGDQRAISFYQV